jgi:hypothetical protein
MKFYLVEVDEHGGLWGYADSGIIVAENEEQAKSIFAQNINPERQKIASVKELKPGDFSEPMEVLISWSHEE